MALKLVGEVSLNAAGFQRGLDGIRTSASTVKNTILTAFGAFSFGQAIRGTIEWASKLRDSSDALGVNVEFLQKLQNGAKLANADIEDITKMMTELGRSREDAFRNPAGRNAQAFGRMGVTSPDITGLSNQKFVEKLIEAFKGGVNTQLTNDVIEVGGKSARNLIAAFFASDTPILAEQLIDQLDAIGDELSSTKTKVFVELAPAIGVVVDAFFTLLNVLKQLGAGITAFYTSLYTRFIQGGITFKPPKEVAKDLIEATTTGTQAMKEERDDQKAEAERIAAGKAAAIAARRRREKAPPGFGDLQPLTKSGRGAQPADSLVSVGNFLGSTGNSLQLMNERKVSLLQQIANNTKPKPTSPTAQNSFAGVGFPAYETRPT